MENSTIADAVRTLLERGYCVVERAHDTVAVNHQEQLLYAEWERRGKPALTGFGMAIHPLVQHVPEIAPYFDTPAVNEILDAAFGDRTRLCHTGARMASQDSAENIGWHDHYGWDKAQVTGRTRIERVVVNYYVKGVSPELGSLWVIPRQVGDPFAPPLGERTTGWPDQVEVGVPPGSAVILDTTLYHTATRGSVPGMRYHWGGHYQGWSDPRPHGEDMDMSGLGRQEELMKKYPGLKRLVLQDD